MSFAISPENGVNCSLFPEKKLINNKKLSCVDEGNLELNMHVDRTPKDVTNESESISRVSCPNCQRSFSTKQSLSTHMKTAKSCIDQKHQKKVFQCNYCNKVLSSKQMLLYHDGICSMKTQHVYEKKLHELQSMIGQGDNTTCETMIVDESRQFYETNILMRCELTNRLARVPKKKGGVVFELYPAIIDPIEISSNTRQIIPLGLKLNVLGGWCAFVKSCSEYRRNDIYCSPMMLCADHNDDLNLTMCNMTNEKIKILPGNPIAEISFFRVLDNYNIHINCTRLLNEQEDL